jgi:ABC-2 type transport system permease protein
MAGIAGASTSSRLPGVPAPDPGRPSYTINLAHVRTLLWLRWKLTVRGYTHSWQRIVSLVAGLLFVIPLAGGLAFVSALGYTNLTNRDSAAQVLFAVVTGLYILWATLPLLQYSLNEGLDVTKLQIYPLTRGEQMLSLVLSTLLDVSTLFIIPLYVAIIVGWHATPFGAVVTVVAIVLAYVHTVGFSQLMLAALMGLLKTRRFRDLTVIVFALFGTFCSFGGQLIARVFEGLGPANQPNHKIVLASLHLERYLHWTPPGMAAQAIVYANTGQYLAALPWLLGSLLLVPVLLRIWAAVLERGITSAESAAAGGGRTRRRASRATSNGAAPAAPAQAASARRWRPISGVALAITAKDARYLWRDPQLKAALISVLFASVVILFPNIYSSGVDSSNASNFTLGGAVVFFAPLPALLIVLAFGLNSLGMDRQGLQTLFLFPVRPLDIFFGKNLFVGGFAFVVATALTLIRAAMSNGWAYAPLALVAGASAILVMLGCGNVTSVLAPFRWRQMRMGNTGSIAQENGCLRSIISLITMFITAILLIPVAAAVSLPLFLNHPEWLVIGLPLAFLYGMAFYQIATRLIAPVLLRREPDILAVTVREA